MIYKTLTTVSNNLTTLTLIEYYVQQNIYIFPGINGTFTKTDHLLDYRKKKITQRIFSDHNGSNDKTSGKIPNRQNINTLLTNPWIKIQKGN